MEDKNAPRLVRVLRQAYEQKKGRAGLEGTEAGFTLIELMVVLLIMAILLAIAIPTFLGVKGSAQDRAVQSDLTNALTSAKASYVNDSSYQTSAGSEVAALASAEPDLSFVANSVEATKSANTLSVGVSTDGQQLVLVGFSGTNTCWAAEDNEGTSTGANVTNAPATPGIEYRQWTESSTNTCSVSGIPSTSTNPLWGKNY